MNHEGLTRFSIMLLGTWPSKYLLVSAPPFRERIPKYGCSPNEKNRDACVILSAFEVEILRQ